MLKNDGNNNVFGIFTLQQIYVLDTQNEEASNKKVPRFFWIFKTKIIKNMITFIP